MKTFADDNYWTEKNLSVSTLIDADASSKLYREIGKNIIRVRESKGLTRKDLSVLISVTEARLVNIESLRFNQRISALLLHLIAVALHVSIFELLPETELVLSLANKDKRVFKVQSNELTLYNEQEFCYFQACLARNIYLQRMRRGLQLKELSEHLGGDQKLALLLKKIETKDAHVDIFLLLAIAHQLSISLDDLLPSIEIDRLYGFVKRLQPRDVLVIHELLKVNPDIFADTIANRVAELPSSDDESLILRGQFFADAMKNRTLVARTESAV